MEEYWKTISQPRQNLKTQSVAEPDLPRTPDPAHSVYANECDLSGPVSRDDDEDSSPFIQDLDLANHVPCSNYDMTGHDDDALTHNGWSRAHASTTNSQLTGSNESRSSTKNCVQLTYDSKSKIITLSTVSQNVTFLQKIQAQ